MYSGYIISILVSECIFVYIAFYVYSEVVRVQSTEYTKIASNGAGEGDALLPFCCVDFGLSHRRNKDCTRSVKKKSGPAKGTKYAARRTRSQDEHGRSSHGGGGATAARGGGSAIAAMGALRRSASTGDRRSSAPSSSSSFSATAIPRVGGRPTPGVGAHAEAHGGHGAPFAPPDLGFMPTGGAGAGGGGGEAAGVAAAAATAARGGAAAAAVEGGMRARGQAADELPMRHQQHGGGVGDSESQQLISNFPGVLQVSEPERERELLLYNIMAG